MAKIPDFDMVQAILGTILGNEVGSESRRPRVVTPYYDQDWKCLLYTVQGASPLMVF